MIQDDQVGIYLLLDADGNPRYIGKSANPCKRFIAHKYLFDWAHRFVILEVVAPWHTWQERERYWVAYYSQFVILENRTRGGDGIHAHLEDTKARMRLTRKGRTHTPAHRESIRLALLGHAVSPATRLKTSRTLKERNANSVNIRPQYHHTEETKAHLSKVRKIYWDSMTLEQSVANSKARVEGYATRRALKGPIKRSPETLAKRAATIAYKKAQKLLKPWERDVFLKK